MSALDIQQSSKVSVRQAQLVDATSISELGSCVFTSTFGHSLQPPDLQAYLDESYSVSAITKDILDKKRDLIVAVDSNHTIVGFAYLTRDTTDPCLANVEGKVELQRLYVDVSMHGKGIGKLLYSRIEEMAIERGFRNLWLSVWEENEKAMRVYDNWGYSQVGDHDFTIGGIVQRDHIMLKAL